MDPITRAEHFPLKQSPHNPVVQYGDAKAAEPHFWREITRQLDGGARRVCDVGGGSRPILSPDGVHKRGLDYVVFDESAGDLQKSQDRYAVFAGDVLDPAAIAALAAEHGPFDALFSRWTAEHVRRGGDFHAHLYSLLRPGGTAVHLFPTLYALPFAVNRALSENYARRLLMRTWPSRRVKFPAYYSWCRGPTKRQLRRLEETGFVIERYVGFFGHGLYAPLPPLDRAHRLLTRALLRRPVPALTSFALVVLRRPA
jgi:hypothetical protein